MASIGVSKTMTKAIIAGNWKMNTSLEEGLSLILGMKDRLEQFGNITPVICPPFTSLVTMANLLKESNIALAAQNMHYESHGAFTGEISPSMLSELCQYVILGHSERREFFSENDHIVNKKILAAIESGVKPILCVGEDLATREGGGATDYVKNQITAALKNVKDIHQVVIAYEPIWAIGTGQSATEELAQEMMSSIRDTVTSLYSKNTSGNVPLLYGGSVNPSNIGQYMTQEDIDGALVGGASLSSDSFTEIVSIAAGNGN